MQGNRMKMTLASQYVHNIFADYKQNDNVDAIAASFPGIPVHILIKYKQGKATYKYVQNDGIIYFYDENNNELD
jgi:hypothetical protein